MDKLRENLRQIRKNDPELDDVLQVVDQIKHVYADIREAQGFTSERKVSYTNNSAMANITFRSNSSSR